MMKMLHDMVMFLVLSESASLNEEWMPYQATSYAPTKSVEVFSHRPDRPYLKMGELIVAGKGCNFALKKAVKKCKKLGADGFVVIEKKCNPRISGKTALKGLVIKF